MHCTSEQLITESYIANLVVTISPSPGLALGSLFFVHSQRSLKDLYKDVAHIFDDFYQSFLRV